MSAATKTLTTSQKARRVFYFFPFQLMFLHLKRNHLLLLLWLILFGIITQNVGQKFGLPYLFLYPEYLNQVNFLSHLILGFSCGGFIMAFNMYSYIMHGFKFRFIATVSRPFQKFSFNNFIIPTAFVIVYIISAARFQYTKELESATQIIFNMLGFVCGMLIFFFFSMYYFFKTNKDLFKISGKKEEQYEAEMKDVLLSVTHKKIKWNSLFSNDQGWIVETYMSSPTRIKLARDCSHYDIELIKKVFAQNHLNASVFEIAIIISFLALGSFKEFAAFLIPAGASIFLLFTIIIMIISALYTWFRGWTLTVILLLSLVLNYLSQKTELFAYRNFAYGLDYSNKLADYSPDNIAKFATDSSAYVRDKALGIEILNRWKNNVMNDQSTNDKPKLIIVCTSGGGIRSALWTFHVLQQLDSASKGKFMKNTRLISGSSGGMIGAAYYRELFLRSQVNERINLADHKYRENISKDVLNPVAFVIATSDVFIRYQKFDDGPYSYTIDRGYMFEKTLNENIGNLFDKRLYEYRIPEENADIPMIVMAPTIINHGRRLVISPLPVSYLTHLNPSKIVNSEPAYGNIEFTKFFKEQNALNLRFSSALRMNATFPYVMPMVSLPCKPAVEVMDAGVRDNYGISMAILYLYEFNYWIANNTSGVVIVNIRDRPKKLSQETVNSSVYHRLLKPVGNVLDNIFYMQDFENDDRLYYLQDLIKSPVEVVEFCLRHDEKNKVSLSWHLTQLEKKHVLGSIKFEENARALNKVVKMISE